MPSIAETVEKHKDRLDDRWMNVLMKKPRIFINMTYMEVGGAERALLGLLNALDTDRVDVDLFVNQHTGEFMELIPPKIHLIPESKPYSYIRKPIKDAFKHGQIGIAISRLIARQQYNRDVVRRHISGCGNHYVMDRVIKHLPSLHHLGEYDLAISFIDPSHIIHDKVRARKRIEWLHTDFTALNMDEQSIARTWGRDDHIVAISQDMADRFKEKYPQYSSKVILIENIISPQTVRQEADKAEAREMETRDVLKILSIGRICPEKNFECIPDVSALLKQAGLDFEWYVVGPGDATSIMQRATELDVDNRIHFLGMKKNPYPYIKACDIYVQPSRREGKCVSVREAQILCKPVIITRYPTSGSQVIDGVDGMICELNHEGVARAIIDLAGNAGKRKELVDYMRSHDYGNEAEVEKIYRMID